MQGTFEVPLGRLSILHSIARELLVNHKREEPETGISLEQLIAQVAEMVNGDYQLSVLIEDGLGEGVPYDFEIPSSVLRQGAFRTWATQLRVAALKIISPQNPESVIEAVQNGGTLEDLLPPDEEVVVTTMLDDFAQGYNMSIANKPRQLA